jgi:phage FluMu protein Com
MSKYILWRCKSCHWQLTNEKYKKLIVKKCPNCKEKNTLKQFNPLNDEPEIPT